MLNLFVFGHLKKIYLSFNTRLIMNKQLKNFRHIPNALLMPFQIVYVKNVSLITLNGDNSVTSIDVRAVFYMSKMFFLIKGNFKIPCNLSWVILDQLDQNRINSTAPATMEHKLDKSYSFTDTSSKQDPFGDRYSYLEPQYYKKNSILIYLFIITKPVRQTRRSQAIKPKAFAAFHVGGGPVRLRASKVK